MSGKKMVVALMLLFSVVIGAAQASPLDQDFDALTVGNYSTPLSSGVTSAGASDIGAELWYGTTASIVDASSIPADPFGGTGNQSLRLYTPTSPTHGSRAWYRGDSVSSNARFEIDIHKTSGYAYIDVQNGAALAAVGLIAIDDTTFRTNASGAARVTFDQNITANTAYKMVLNLDLASQTYTGTLNGAALTSGGGTISTFSFLNTVTEVSQVHLQSFSAADTYGEFFVDDLSLTQVPEPLTMGLLGVGGLLVLRRRK